MNTKDRKNVWNALFVCFYAGWGAMLYRMFMRQAIAYPGKLGNYPSDLIAHIEEGIRQPAYSLMEQIFGVMIRDLGMNAKAVGILLSALTLGTLWVTYRIMRKLVPEGNPALLHLMAIVCMAVAPLYIKALNPNRYLGLQTPTIWHNSTYIGMKFGAMCVLLFYYGYQETYREKFSVWDFIWFTVLLAFTNLCKPNFIVAFAPAMAVMLLTDCIASKGRTLKRQIVIGIPVLISLLVLIRQNAILFNGSNESSSLGFSLAYVLRMRTDHPIASLLQSAAFPLVVLAANLRDLKTDRRFRVTWLMWLVGLFEYLFINDMGYRQNDGNLTWGYCFCLFPVFMVSLCWLYRNGKEFRDAYKASGKTALLAYVRENPACRGKLAYLALALVLIGLHLYFGLVYFGIVYLGGSYF